MILTFPSSKGGVGKCTTCAAIAAALALNGARVLLIDLDQNRTLDRWAREGRQLSSSPSPPLSRINSDRSFAKVKPPETTIIFASTCPGAGR
jgi:cellulose biosynthesis protein BcsQ